MSLPDNPEPEREAEVVLVDDNPHDAELTIRALKAHRLTSEIIHFSDGSVALESFGLTEPASPLRSVSRAKLILLDLKLPRVDGFEILRCLKTNPRTRSIPVVILTSSREEPDVIRSYQLGANSYIVKPTDFQGFTRVVADLGVYWLLLNQAST